MLPVTMTRSDLLRGVAELSPWFYPFDFGEGLIAPIEMPPEVASIHQTRLEMLEAQVKGHFGDRLRSVECLDVGCNEGFFSLALSRLTRRVTAVDPRAENLRRARFVKEALDVDNIDLKQGRVETVARDVGRTYDLTLLFGVLYHVEDPMLCLRQMAAVTGDLCLIETQVVDEVEGYAEWGSRDWKHPFHGILALIDDSRDVVRDARQTGLTSLSACPSVKALLYMLEVAGFARAKILKPPPGAYEQHARGQRVVCAAYKRA